jgi:hypothetical protein
VDDVDEDIDEDYNDIDDGYVESKTVEKKKNKKAEPLPCSHSQYVGLLQDLLVFHAWYKCGYASRKAIFCSTILKHDKNMHSHLAWIQQKC